MPLTAKEFIQKSLSQLTENPTSLETLLAVTIIILVFIGAGSAVGEAVAHHLNNK